MEQHFTICFLGQRWNETFLDGATTGASREIAKSG